MRTVRQRPQAESAHAFFRWVYESEAETLPEFPDIRKEPDSSGDSDDLPPGSATTSSSDKETLLVDSASVAKQRKKRKKVYDDLGVMVEGTFLPPLRSDAESESAVPKEVRWLAPMSLRFLFRQYKVVWRGAASLPTFWSVYRSAWEHVLRRRETRQHSKCDICEQLKAAVRGSNLKSDTIQYQRQYDQHQREQFADRRVYYSCRSSSANWARGVVLRRALREAAAMAHVVEHIRSHVVFSQWAMPCMGLSGLRGEGVGVRIGEASVCTIIIDGMDQAKFRVPRILQQLIASSCTLQTKLAKEP